MDGQVAETWVLVLMLGYVPTIVALLLIGRTVVVRGRLVGLDILDIAMVLVFCWAGALVYFLIAFLRHRQETRVMVAAPPAVEEDEAVLSRVDEAYARAWADASTAADDDLIDALRQAGLGPGWTEPGRPRADLVLAIWRAGATPRSASRQLREALVVRSGRAGDPLRDRPAR